MEKRNQQSIWGSIQVSIYQYIYEILIDRPKPHKQIHLVISGLSGTALVISRFIKPSSLPEICIFKIFTGIPCMFCGLTHAFHEITLGNFAQAKSYHPLGLFAFVVVTFLFIFDGLRVIFWQNMKRVIFFEESLIKIILVILTTFWLVRLFSGTLI